VRCGSGVNLWPELTVVLPVSAVFIGIAKAVSQVKFRGDPDAVL
jgi:hypothetical protein